MLRAALNASKPQEARDSIDCLTEFQKMRFSQDGQYFSKAKKYAPAMSNLEKAILINPRDKSALLTRAECHLNQGRPNEALADIDAVLQMNDRPPPPPQKKTDTTTSKQPKKEDVAAQLKLEREKVTTAYKKLQALYLKAQALYQKGDFENALVFYNRGHLLRQDDLKFRLGIQLCQEAINTSVGKPKSVNLRERTGLPRHRSESIKKLSKKPMAAGKTFNIRELSKEKIRQKPQSKNFAELLGPLYKDHQFLEALHTEASVRATFKRINQKITNKDEDATAAVAHHADDALTYLTKRAEFWQEQQPLYARERDRRILYHSSRAHLIPGDPLLYLLKELEQIDKAQDVGNYLESLKRAQNALTVLQSYGEKYVQGKLGLLANLYHSMGNSCLELGHLKEALEYHQKDLDIGERGGLAEIRDRSLDNIGRTKARMGKFEEAIETWTTPEHGRRSGFEEHAWLHYETGRCHIHMYDFEQAKEEAVRSLIASEQIHNTRWQMHALLLLGEAEAGLGSTDAVVEAFEKAAENARRLNDRPAHEQIIDALLKLTGHSLLDFSNDYMSDSQWEAYRRERLRVEDEYERRKSSSSEKDDSSTLPLPTVISREYFPESFHNSLSFDYIRESWDTFRKFTSFNKAQKKATTPADHNDNTHLGQATNAQTWYGQRARPQTSEVDGSQNASTSTKNTNNSVYDNADNTASGVKSDKLKRVKRYNAKGKRYCGMKTAAFQTSRDSYDEARNITFQQECMSRPQTTKLMRRSRPKTAPHQEKKPARSGQTYVTKSGKLTRTKSGEPPIHLPSTIPSAWSAEKADTTTCKDRKGFPADDGRDVATSSVYKGLADDDNRDVAASTDHSGFPDDDNRDVATSTDHSGFPDDDDRDVATSTDHNGPPDDDDRDMAIRTDHNGSPDDDDRDVAIRTDHNGPPDDDDKDVAIRTDHDDNMDVAIRTDRNGFPDDGGYTDRQADRLGSTNCYSLFNVSFSDSDDMPLVDDVHVQSSIAAFPSDSASNINSDIRHHSMGIRKDSDTNKSKFRAVCGTSTADTDRQPDKGVQNVRSELKVPIFSSSSSGARQESAVTYSYYSLPHSPFRAGSDTQVLEAARPMPDSSTEIFYSDSRINNWLTEVSNSFSESASDRYGTVHRTTPGEHLSPGYPLGSPDNFPRIQRGRTRFTRSPRTSGFQHSTHQSFQSTALEFRNVDDLDFGSQADYNENNIQIHPRPVNSKDSNRRPSATAHNSHKPLIKGARKKSAGHYTVPAGCVVKEAKESDPVGAGPSSKSITLSILENIYDPLGLRIQPASSKKERAGAQKRQLSRSVKLPSFKRDLTAH